MPAMRNADWKTQLTSIKGTIVTETAKHAKVETEVFVRKPFFVEAVQVTAENIYDVADWCRGSIRQDLGALTKGESVDYIQVKVHRPLNEKQTQAFIGDWILYAGTGYKVYTNKAFTGCFEPTGSAPVQKEAAEAVGLHRI